MLIATSLQLNSDLTVNVMIDGCASKKRPVEHRQPDGSHRRPKPVKTHGIRPPVDESSVLAIDDLLGAHSFQRNSEET